MIDPNGWGAPEAPPEPRIRNAGRRGAELLAVTDDGRCLTFAPTLLAGRETLAVLVEGALTWHEATDAERRLLGTHDVALAYVAEHGSAIDAWIAAPPVRGLREPLTEAEADALLGSDAPRPALGLEPPEREDGVPMYVEPPNWHTVWARLADEDRWFA